MTKQLAEQVPTSNTAAERAIMPWLDMLSGFLDRGIPSASLIWEMGQKLQKTGDATGAKRCEQLNYMLHNSSIPNSVKMGEGTVFGYGGIGVVIHGLAELGKGVVVGTNVTIGGKTNPANRINSNETRIYVPKIGDYVYLATGCKVLGGVEIGAMSIIGANSVVISDIPPLSVAAGSPAKVKKRITPENCLEYRGSFSGLKHLSREEFVEYVREMSLTLKDVY